MFSFREHLVIWSIVAALVAGIVVLVVYAERDHDRWAAWCRSKGGHVTDHTSTTTGFGVSANGNPVVTTGSETTYYCLSSDGRILDIK